jgi:hypothetical protein
VKLSRNKNNPKPSLSQRFKFDKLEEMGEIDIDFSDSDSGKFISFTIYFIQIKT